MRTAELIIAVSIMATVLKGAVVMVEIVHMNYIVESTAAVLVSEPVQLLTLPECGHLYNVGRSAEWQICMGVGKK